MKTIWKFELEMSDDLTVMMPAGADVLTVQAQNNTPCLWAIVDPDEPQVGRRFKMRGTGHPLDGTEGQHLGTFQLSSGKLVFHLFEPRGAR